MYRHMPIDTPSHTCAPGFIDVHKLTREILLIVTLNMGRFVCMNSHVHQRMSTYCLNLFTHVHVCGSIYSHIHTYVHTYTHAYSRVFGVSVCLDELPPFFGWGPHFWKVAGELRTDQVQNWGWILCSGFLFLFLFFYLPDSRVRFFIFLYLKKLYYQKLQIK